MRSFLRLVNDPFHWGEEPARCTSSMMEWRVLYIDISNGGHCPSVSSTVNMGIEFYIPLLPTPWLHGPFP